MTIRVDFTGASEGFTPLEAGPYPAKVSKVELSETKGNSGYHSLIFEWKIIGTNRTIKFDYYSLSPQALWRLKQVLTALGIDVPEGEFEVEPSDIVNSEATLILKIEEYNGRENNKVELVKPADGFSG